jgi:hypothetical protein
LALDECDGDVVEAERALLGPVAIALDLHTRQSHAASTRRRTLPFSTSLVSMTITETCCSLRSVSVSRAPVAVPNHAPEVRDGVREWPLRGDVALLVALLALSTVQFGPGHCCTDRDKISIDIIRP